MKCVEFAWRVDTATFHPEKSSLFMEFQTDDPSAVDGKHFEFFEERANTDGTPWSQYGLTEAVGLLTVARDAAEPLRAKLNENGGVVAECSITSQFGEYVGFRGYSYFWDAPEAAVFRFLQNDDQMTCMSYGQFYSVEFAAWLKDNYDTRGLRFIELDGDGRVAPRRILPRPKLPNSWPKAD